MKAAVVRACARQSRSRPSVRFGIGCLGTCALILIAPLILAQSGGGYDLNGNTQGAGGGTLTGASGYSLNVTIEHPDANSLGTMTGTNGYALRGGFLPGTGQGDVIFRDGFDASQ